MLTLQLQQLEHIYSVMRLKPTVIAITLDRPYVIPEIAQGAAALLATFGVSDEALLDVVMGRFASVGKLPFELPSSMEAVRAQLEDAPFDSKDPLFKFGHGLRNELAAGEERVRSQRE